MGKSNARNLPPLVYGKLTGIFEFAVEKIEITEKIFKNENCHLLVKVIWWGETEPLFVRPKRIQFVTKGDKEIITNEPARYSLKYKVNTNLKLFKSYLEKCEVLELVILNSVQNEVIGSAFLRDLIYLVFNTHLFTASIVNYSGDSIGEISCYFLFKETDFKDSLQKTEKITEIHPVQKQSADNLKINLKMLNMHSSKESKEDELTGKNQNNSFLNGSFISSQNVLNDFYSQRSSTVHYNSPVTQKSELKNDDLKTPHITDYLVKKSNITSDFLEDLHLPEQSRGTEKLLLLDSSKNVSDSNLPDEPVRILQPKDKDKRKLINRPKRTFLVNKKQEDNVNRNRIHNVAHSAKMINKKAITSKVKSYIENKAPKNKNTFREKAVIGGRKNSQRTVNSSNSVVNWKYTKISNDVVKPTGNIKTFVRVSKEISRLNKLYLKPSKVSSDDHSDLEKVPVKEKIMDISVHNAQDHDSYGEVNGIAKNVEKNINITESSRNCQFRKINNEDHTIKFDRNIKPKQNAGTQERVNVDNKLYFDLNDPVEKAYYETFFSKYKNVCNNEFEIAELLNQPENKYILEVAQIGTLDENAQQLDGHLLRGEGNNNSKNSYFCNKDDIRKNNMAHKGKVPDPSKIGKEDSCIISESVEPSTGAHEVSSLTKNHEEYKTDCHRCKYYKKLSELDKIIEALKTFEARLKNEVVLSSQSLNVDECSKNFLCDHPPLPRSNSSAQTIKGDKYDVKESSDEELALGIDIDGSDFSKEDSDFIEFTHYLSKRSFMEQTAYSRLHRIQKKS